MIAVHGNPGMRAGVGDRPGRRAARGWQDPRGTPLVRRGSESLRVLFAVGVGCVVGAWTGSPALGGDARGSVSAERRESGSDRISGAPIETRVPTLGAIPLAPRSNGAEPRGGVRRSPGASAGAVVGSLGAVIGLFLLVTWFCHRAAPASKAVLPGEVLRVLGRAPLAGRHVLQLVRVGNKLVLLSASGAAVSAVAEITDPDEVERLCGICERRAPGSITASFRNALRQFGEERTAPGFLGDERRAESRLAASGAD